MARTIIPVNTFKAFRFLHLAIVGGLTLILVVSVMLVEFDLLKIPPDESLDRILQVVVVILAIGFVFPGFRLFQSRILKLRSGNFTAAERITKYRTACITWWGMIELPAFVAVVGFMITKNYAFMAVALFLWLILLVFTPRRDNMMMLLKLTEQDGF